MKEPKYYIATEGSDSCRRFLRESGRKSYNPML